MSFAELARVEEPGREELVQFVLEAKSFLRAVVEDRERFDFLWEENEDLRELALDTLRRDILEGAGLILEQAIPFIYPGIIYQHGLDGPALRFKIAVVAAIEVAEPPSPSEQQTVNELPRSRRIPIVREWFKKMIDAIDAVLDSLISASGGSGGVIKEFKDALRALG